jgi:glycine cleavage system H lipoate-binding protein
MEHKASHKTAPKVEAFSMKENQCIWMKAGIVNFKLCENAYDCLSCRFDKAMLRRVEEQPERASGWGEALAKKPYSEKECRHMLTGRVRYHFCSNSYRCHTCEFDQGLEEMDLADVKGSVTVRRIAGFQAADSYYYHRGHSWARVEHGGLVRIGVDDFALRLIGHPTEIKLPKLGSHMEQTEVGWSVKREEKTAHMLSPVSGVILAANHKVINQPDKAKRDPYHDGWLLVVEPRNLRPNLKNLLFEEEAEAWLNAESKKIETMVMGAYGLPLAATGGEIVEDIYGNVANKIGWDELVREFLLT